MLPVFATPKEWYGFYSQQVEGHTRAFVLAPLLWSMCAPPVRLRWRKVPFTDNNVTQVPNNSKGVYSFVVRPTAAGQPGGEYVFYVGRVGGAKRGEDRSFRERYLEYLSESKTANPRRIEIALALTKWKDSAWFYWAPIRDTKKIEHCEDSLIKALRPPLNKMGTATPKPPVGAFQGPATENEP